MTKKQQGLSLSLLFLGVLLLGWHSISLPKTITAPADPVALEYAILMGDLPEHTAPLQEVVRPSDIPSPTEVGKIAVHQLTHPFSGTTPSNQGIGWQLIYSLGRVLAGFGLAFMVAVPIGYAIGRSPVLSYALTPWVQLLKPISPLAWMPLALYTIKEANASSIFVIFICSLWPMLTNTAFGVAGVDKTWQHVAKVLELSPIKTATSIILPAAASAIVTGMRISMGVAWLVIVAAEMLVGSSGIGYFVWNAWNNLSLPEVIFAVLVIGLVGMVLDMAFVWLQKKVSYEQ